MGDVRNLLTGQMYPPSSCADRRDVAIRRRALGPSRGYRRRRLVGDRRHPECGRAGRGKGRKIRPSYVRTPALFHGPVDRAGGLSPQGHRNRHPSSTKLKIPASARHYVFIEVMLGDECWKGLMAPNAEREPAVSRCRPSRRTGVADDLLRLLAELARRGHGRRAGPTADFTAFRKTPLALPARNENDTALPKWKSRKTLGEVDISDPEKMLIVAEKGAPELVKAKRRTEIVQVRGLEVFLRFFEGPDKASAQKHSPSSPTTTLCRSDRVRGDGRRTRD